MIVLRDKTLSGSLRALKPLRIPVLIQKFRKILSIVMKSIYDIKEILLITLLLVYIYSIAGVVLWTGDIHYRCRITPTPVNGDWKVIENDTRPCGSRKCEVGY